MKIQTREIGKNTFEVTVETSDDKVRVTEDVTTRYVGGGYKVDQQIINEFITAARSMTLFNGENDVDFLKNAIEHFASKSEREEILAWLQETL